MTDQKKHVKLKVELIGCIKATAFKKELKGNNFFLNRISY